MSRYGLTDSAKSDLRSIHQYIRRDSPESAARMVESIREAFRLIAKRPLIGRARPDLSPHLRSFVVKSYLIYYRIEKRGITVMRVLHGALDATAAFEAE
jgi:toxin ParE1/3/4